jgi:formate dehydrogenase subunit gamma
MTQRRAWDPDLASRLIDDRKAAAGALMPVLHALQDEFGYVDRAAIPLIAEALNISKAEVHGVLTFYHDFRDAPAKGPVLKLCRAESCQAMGCEDLIAHLAERHSLTPDEPGGAGRIEIKTVYCLGNCALSPAGLIDERPVGRLTAAKLDALVGGGAA